MTVAIGYVRVSTADQVEHGASLDAQRVALADEAHRRGWDLRIVTDEGVSGKDLIHRPRLRAVLDDLDAGRADVLLALRLDRVSRSVVDFGSTLDRALRHHWAVRLLSPDIDFSDANGRFMGNVLAAAAQFERDLIAMRTREGMAQRRAEGVHCGRPRVLSATVVGRIVRLRADGWSLRRIADVLTGERVGTAHGGTRWWPSTVRGVLLSEAARR